MDKITSHLHSYLNSKNIPFNTLPFGVQIDRKYFDHDTFQHHNLYFLGETFVIHYSTLKTQYYEIH